MGAEGGGGGDEKQSGVGFRRRRWGGKMEEGSVPEREKGSLRVRKLMGKEMRFAAYK